MSFGHVYGAIQNNYGCPAWAFNLRNSNNNVETIQEQQKLWLQFCQSICIPHPLTSQIYIHSSNSSLSFFLFFLSLASCIETHGSYMSKKTKIPHMHEKKLVSIKKEKETQQKKWGPIIIFDHVKQRSTERKREKSGHPNSNGLFYYNRKKFKCTLFQLIINGLHTRSDRI